MLTIDKFNQLFTKDLTDTMDNAAYDPALFAIVNRIFDVADTTEYTESFHSTEGFEGTTYLDENQNLNNGNLDKGYRVSIESREFGHYIDVSKKARVQARDNTLAISEIIAKQKKHALYDLNNFVTVESMKMLNEAFGSTTIKAPDGQNIISATHLWKDGSQAFDNLLAPVAISATQVDDVLKRNGSLVDSKGKPMPSIMNKIIVKKGGKASVEARKLFGLYGSQYSPTVIGDINIYMGEFDIIETPYITSDTAYFFMGDMMNGDDNPLFVNFMERPKIQGPARVTDNLSYRWDYAGSFKYGVRNLPFNILGSQGA